MRRLKQLKFILIGFCFVFASALLISLKFAKAADYYSNTDHGGTDWTLADGDRIAGVHTNIGTFNIPPGANVRVGPSGSVEIQANTDNIQGTLRNFAGGPVTITPTTCNTLPPATGIDIGLNYYYGGLIYKISADPIGTFSSPLRIYKGGQIYSIQLVAPNDPDASPFRIFANSTTWALKKL